MTAMTEDITDEQRDEWSALHSRIAELDRRHEQANRSVSYSLVKHVEAGAMTPAEFGLPSPAAVEDYRRACEYAKEAAALWAERVALYEQVKAHPYTAVVDARREVSR